MHEVEYERLVADPEGTARALLEYCGLDWDPGCLNFHAAPREVRTASLAQVRRPLYRGAVGRARNYEAYLRTVEGSARRVRRPSRDRARPARSLTVGTPAVPGMVSPLVGA